MKNFTSVHDVPDLAALVQRAADCKARPLAQQHIGRGKTLGLLFMNPSLRTRLSTQKAAANLGLHTMTLDVGRDSWALEFEDGTIMDTGKSEHIREAAAVLGQYCDIIALRSFAALESREEDARERELSALMRYSGRPVVNLESPLRHPLQSLADVLTIRELHKAAQPPKVVLSWAPHPRALPQAVANSFVEWIGHTEAELTIACPEGFELAPEFSKYAQRIYNKQEEAFAGADIVYAKNWSAWSSYGATAAHLKEWCITEATMKPGNAARFMHCLPVRRNVVVADEVLDGPRSAVIQQAANRVPAAQAVLQSILEAGV